MLLCVRLYVAYSLWLRNLEEMMAERAIGVGSFNSASLGHQVGAVVRKDVSQAQAPGGA